MLMTDEQLLEMSKLEGGWKTVSIVGSFSADLMAKYKHNLDWKILTSRRLPLHLVERFNKYVDWNYISKRYNMNEKFILEHKDRLDLYLLANSRYCNIPMKFRKKLLQMESDRIQKIRKTGVIK